MIAVAAATTVFVIVGAVTGSWRIVPVRSGSMAPVAPKGYAVLAQPSRATKLRVGDVVLFRAPTPEHPLVVHRIDEVVTRNGERLYRTKGDANGSPDPWLIRMRSATVWRAQHVIPKLGSVVDVVSRPMVRMAILVLATLVLLGLGLRRVWRRADAAEGDVGLGATQRARVAAAAATAATTTTAFMGRSSADVKLAEDDDDSALHTA